MDKLVTKARIALRLTSTGYDDQLDLLIKAAKQDLSIAGVTLPDDLDAISEMAILTYVMAHFGQQENYDKLKASYDEKKAQLQTATGYTVWGDGDV